jgi:hypothetical protein
MSNRSDEVMKQLNRLVNDRNITPQARNQIREAMNHIRDLHYQLSGPVETAEDFVPD